MLLMELQASEIFYFVFWEKPREISNFTSTLENLFLLLNSGLSSLEKPEASWKGGNY